MPTMLPIERRRPQSSEARLPKNVQQAATELQTLIRQRYPDATFSVTRGQDDPNAFHLRTVVDVEDTDAVRDFVRDRIMEIQIDQGVPIFVIPVRTPERVKAMRTAEQAKPRWSVEPFPLP
jgi:translation elongation factor EF-1alpha